jgi:2-polyprenyl-3-methyl-5-hydroxy-6-metoxy-1,4-benzoquinol methylase
MNFEKLAVFVKEQVGKIPISMQKIVFKTAAEVRYVVFRLKLMRITHRDILNPARIYLISPDRITYHTNYLENSSAKAMPFAKRVFDSKMRGKVVDGNWDITPYKFTDLTIYKSFKKRIEDRVEWQNTEFYKGMLTLAKSGVYRWGVKNKDDLDKRCEYLDSLYQSIKNDGYHLNRDICNKTADYDEIDVNIGRNGEYLFQNGVHRLSVAKILGIKSVPVMVFVRHKKWVEFRQFVVLHARQQSSGKLYQPLVHPDLADIPYDLQSHNCQELMETIKDHLEKKKGVMLDIGANVGYFCHKFEDIGYRCYAVEVDPATFRILEKVKIAENKKFEIINKSIFEVESIKNMKFDVVVALNIFHHFLKAKTDFLKFEDLLKNLKTDVLFFEPHLYRDDQMKDAYVNYTETKFVDFLLSHTSLNKSEIIYTAKNGRKVFKLSR